MVDPTERTVAVYTSDTRCRVLRDDEILDGGEVLPGLQIDLGQYFGELDRRKPG